MNKETIYRHFVSFITTFLATFFTVIGVQLMSGIPTEISHDFVIGLSLAAVRAAFKAGVETLGMSGDRV
jgi:hypothetical protein